MGQSVQRPNELGAQEKQEEEQDGHGHRGHRSVNGDSNVVPSLHTPPTKSAHVPYDPCPRPFPTTNHPTNPININHQPLSPLPKQKKREYHPCRMYAYYITYSLALLCKNV